MKFNSTRLVIARKRRELNIKELALLLKVEPHTVSRWESSFTDEPTSENLNALVRILKFPREFFFGPDLDEPNSQSASFRSQTKMLAGTRDAAFAAGSIGFHVSDWIDKRFNLPEVDVPNLQEYLEEPEEAARTLREEWNCGEKPINNLIHLLESRGVRVFSLSQNTAAVNAFSLWRDGRPYVFLNNYKSAESSRFDAAHELAHLILHQDGGVTDRKAEVQAHAFASALLMPKADVIAMLPRVHGIYQLIGAKRRWKVSVAALNYRIHRLGITSDWKYRDFCIEISKRGYHRAEINGIDREKSKVWEMVLKSLWAEKITQRDIARELHIPEAELNDLLCGVLSLDWPKGKIINTGFTLVADSDQLAS